MFALCSYSFVIELVIRYINYDIDTDIDFITLVYDNSIV